MGRSKKRQQGTGRGGLAEEPLRASKPSKMVVPTETGFLPDGDLHRLSCWNPAQKESCCGGCGWIQVIQDRLFPP